MENDIFTGVMSKPPPWSGKKLYLFSLIVLISAFPVMTGADSFRCGRKVVRSGDSSSTVLQNCGKPLSKDSGYERVRLEDGQKKVRVERWHYKKTSRSLERVVMIYRGRVVAIETGQR